MHISNNGKFGLWSGLLFSVLCIDEVSELWLQAAMSVKRSFWWEFTLGDMFEHYLFVGLAASEWTSIELEPASSISGGFVLLYY